jgi:hypothetical protein
MAGSRIDIALRGECECILLTLTGKTDSSGPDKCISKLHITIMRYLKQLNLLKEKVYLPQFWRQKDMVPASAQFSEDHMTNGKWWVVMAVVRACVRASSPILNRNIDREDQ